MDVRASVTVSSGIVCSQGFGHGAVSQLCSAPATDDLQFCPCFQLTACARPESAVVRLHQEIHLSCREVCGAAQELAGRNSAGRKPGRLQALQGTRWAGFAERQPCGFLHGGQTCNEKLITYVPQEFLRALPVWVPPHPCFTDAASVEGRITATYAAPSGRQCLGTWHSSGAATTMLHVCNGHLRKALPASEHRPSLWPQVHPGVLSASAAGAPAAVADGSPRRGHLGEGRRCRRALLPVPRPVLRPRLAGCACRTPSSRSCLLFWARAVAHNILHSHFWRCTGTRLMGTARRCALLFQLCSGFAGLMSAIHVPALCSIALVNHVTNTGSCGWLLRPTDAEIHMCRCLCWLPDDRLSHWQHHCGQLLDGGAGDARGKEVPTHGACLLLPVAGAQCCILAALPRKLLCRGESYCQAIPALLLVWLLLLVGSWAMVTAGATRQLLPLFHAIGWSVRGSELCGWCLATCCMSAGPGDRIVTSSSIS
jgi:hypothetical protein